MKRKSKIGMVVLIVIAGSGFWFWKSQPQKVKEEVKEISPRTDKIEVFISTTGTIQPQNRLEIKPPINGRIDKVLVKEGDHVKVGQILAWMSSTDRAALLDAARPQGEEAMKYWSEVYKPTPLIASIDGEVIVSKTQPGQTLTAADPVVVLSDHLIVQAQVDETDIGKVEVGQKARLSLDAYPDIKVNGQVDHIYYESLVVNNVTIYQVDILPTEVPKVFRSGMSATVEIIQKSKENALLVPVEAVRRGKDETFVLLSQGPNQKPLRQKIETGISDDKDVEIISGLKPEDRIVITNQKYTAPKGQRSGSSSPFMPTGRRGGGR